MPSGSNNYLWTSEYENDNYVGEIRWLNEDPNFTGYFDTYMTWVAHTTNTLQYRTVYYPIDEDYFGPDIADCQGGRFEAVKDLGNGNAVHIWADMYDRDSTTYQDAIRECHAVGGHLASRRDLVELITNGLPNGSGNFIWTSDNACNDQMEAIRWNGTYDPDAATPFADQWSTDATDVIHDGVVKYPFRCVWTNEVRIR